MRFLEEFEKYYSTNKENQDVYNKNLKNNPNCILKNEEIFKISDFDWLKFWKILIQKKKSIISKSNWNDYWNYIINSST